VIYDLEQGLVLLLLQKINPGSETFIFRIFSSFFWLLGQYVAAEAGCIWYFCGINMCFLSKNIKI
jgi:hypothetical protein